MSTVSLTAAIKAEARRLGFDLAGVCSADAPLGIDRFHAWLDAGYAGQMQYIPDRAEAYEHPRHVLAGVRSVVMLAMNYNTGAPLPPGEGQARVSRYAWGTGDYHDLIHDRLKQLCQFVQSHAPEAAVRGVVDTAPLLEREFAQLAGLGWIGKNTLLLNRHLGSWFFLAALLTDQVLEFDLPHETDHCGTCRACLDACPTDAFVEPYVLDATRCISYLTIELREPIPEPLRGGVGNWLFGCDVCQDVCPWNQRAPLSSEQAFQSTEELNPIDARALFQLDEAAFRRRFRHTPLWRSRRRGILRNAAIVLGNQPSIDSLAALERGLNDDEPLVRASAAWALGRHRFERARRLLAARRAIETDELVSNELAVAIPPVP